MALNSCQISIESLVGKLMKVGPPTGGIVTEDLKSTPTNIEITCEENRALKGLSNLGSPGNDLTIQYVLVTPDSRIGKQIQGKNVDRDLRHLNNRVQESLRTPRLHRQKLWARGKHRVGTGQTNTSAQTTKRAKGTGNRKLIWNGVGTRQVKTKTTELRKKGRQSPPRVGSFAECDDLALPLTHQITLAQKLGRVSRRKGQGNLWSGFGDSSRLWGVAQNFLQFIVA